MKKLIISLICISSILAVNVQAQDDYFTLPKKSPQEIKQFCEEYPKWKLSYGICGCCDHSRDILKNGQFVNLCIQEGDLYKHYLFKVKGNKLVLRLFRETNENKKTTRQCRRKQLNWSYEFSDAKIKFSHLKLLFGLYFKGE